MFGEHNGHLRHLEEVLSLDIASRGNNVALKGESNNVDLAQEVLQMLWEKIQRKQDVTTSEIDAALRFLKGEDQSMTNKAMTKKSKDKKALYDEAAGIKTYKNKLISPRSPNQAKYIEAIRGNDMVLRYWSGRNW